MAFRVDKSSAFTPVRRDDGSVRVQANLTRTGVFTYRQANGQPWRELRLADEVFSPDSLASYAGKTLTVGHPGDVNSENWSDLAVGDVRDDAKPDGIFVRATVQINDGKTVSRVCDKKELSELSCGYTCEIENVSGEWEGQHYDAIQRNIRLNHVALGPKNWGRAGGEVKLLLDSRADALVEDSSEGSLDSITMDLAKALEELGVAKAESAAQKSRADAAEGQVKTLTDQVSTLQGSLDAQKSAAEGAQAKLKAVEDGIPARVDARVALLDQARKVCGKDFKSDGKSELDIKKEVIAKIDNKLSLEGRADSYVDGAFETLVARWDGGRQSVNEAITSTLTADLTDKARQDGGEDLVAIARARSEKNAKEAFKPATKTLNSKAVNLANLGMKP